MQSLVVYGRLLARAVFTGINNEFTQHGQFANSQTWSCAQPSAQARDLHLVTASSGFSKSHSPSQVYKKWCFGDDACFSAAHKLADVIGVADGVGGWRTYGVDPSQFPRLLMNTCERIVKEGQFRPHAPVGLIAAGYAEMLENKKPLIGSCTACVVSLYREQRTMYTANLGDSGFLLIREGEVIHRSEEQQHYFNTPFQLSMAPTTLQGLVLSDSPESAESSSIPVQEGDLILLGTDGLFDNMNEEMILLHLSKLKDSRRESMQQVANSLCEEAHDLAFDPDFMSPFALNANANGIDIKGGKPDDITVMLSRVTEGDPYS